MNELEIPSKNAIVIGVSVLYVSTTVSNHLSLVGVDYITMKHSLFIAAVSLLYILQASALTLAQNGKSGYAILCRTDANQTEKAAVKDLAWHLKAVTGAEFPIIASPVDSPMIRVGGDIPGEKTAFPERSRRVKVTGKDLILTGEGEYGPTFAVYDFLEKVVGCHWYAICDEPVIPKKPTLIIDDNLDITVNPSILVAEAGLSPLSERPAVSEFFRRNRIFIMPRFVRAEADDSWQFIGPTCHSLGYYLPAGDIKGERQGPRMGPHPMLRDKKYFDTNPEYFSLLNGKRVPKHHYCFSNPGMRSTFIGNMLKILKADSDPKRNALAVLDINDAPGPSCECDNCRALMKKYKCSGGAFFDFLLELAPVIAREFPNVRIRFLAYGRDMTLAPPDLGGRKLPENLIPSYCPLTSDIAKPLSAPSNRERLAELAAWQKVADTLYLSHTPIHWEYPTKVPALLAGAARMVDDLRTGHKLGVRMFNDHYSGNLIDRRSFRPLLLFLLARFSEDINRDFDATVAEYCRARYGAAWQEMQKYINELDRLAAAEPHFLRWNSNPKVLSYVNPVNLHRFQQDFDRMEKMVINDPAALSNVRAERVAVDLNTIYIWDEYSRHWSLSSKDLDRIAERCLANLKDNLKAMKALMRKYKIRSAPSIAQYETEITRGYRVALAAAKPAKSPLPDGATFSVMPEIELRRPVVDPDAAHGYAIEVKQRRGPLLIVYQDGGQGGSVVPNDYATRWSGVRLTNRSPISPVVIAKLPPEAYQKYCWYKVGKARLTYDCTIFFREPKNVGYFPFTRCYDPDDPDREYEIFLSMKVMNNGKVRFDRAALRPINKK